MILQLIISSELLCRKPTVSFLLSFVKPKFQLTVVRVLGKAKLAKLCELELVRDDEFLNMDYSLNIDVLDFSCEAGEFLDMEGDKRCHKCPTGHYSLGSGVRYDDWNGVNLPEGFFIDNSSLAVTDEEDRQQCNDV